MKSFFLTILFLLITLVTFSQNLTKTYYTFSFGTNIIDNNNNVDYLIPFIKQRWSYNTPFYVAAEHNFNFDPNFSVSGLITTNQLEIAIHNKNYIAVDVLGKYNFNKLLFDSKKIEVTAGLGLGRYFLDKKGSNTFNYSGGIRYWFSKQFGLDSQLIGKYGLRPINRAVMNHYQLNFGVVWRSNGTKIKVKDECCKELLAKFEIFEQTTKNQIMNLEQLLKDKVEKKTDEKQEIIADSSDYTKKEQNNIAPLINNKSELNVVSTKKGCEYKIGDNLEKCFGVKTIYFAVDKYAIEDPSTISNLEKLFDVMSKNPSMEIEIRSYTDCRQTINYNLKLSDKRAKSTLDWLVAKGISISRLTAKGNIPSELGNNCDCLTTKKTNCTEEQYKLNRRSEFIITHL